VDFCAFLWLKKYLLSFLCNGSGRFGTTEGTKITKYFQNLYKHLTFVASVPFVVPMEMN
jgi:hypothetical protein